MAIVTKVVEEEGKDNYVKTVGIITLEDIMGEFLKHENPSEIAPTMTQKTGRKHGNLLLLFNDNFDGEILDKAEVEAICAYLQRQVKTFN